MELKNIAILGPGGNVGKAILTQLLLDPQHFTNITVITRLTSSYTAPPNITHKKVDYTSASSLTSAFHGQDAVVNCITGSATQYDDSKRIIDAAIAAGVKFFFANEFVGDVMREQFKRMPETFVGAKVRIREYLEEVGKKGEMVWTSLNGGPFFDMWLMKGPAGFDIPHRTARIYGSGTNPLYWTPLPTIAAAAVTMLRDPTRISNRAIYISPIPHLTQALLLQTLESVLQTRFHVEHVDVKTISERAREALERGEGAKAMKGLTVSAQFYEGDAQWRELEALVENETVGVREMGVEEAVRDALERWGEDCEVVEGLYRVEAL